jgi:hypothetical protein
MNTEVVALRLPQGSSKQLRQLAHQRSLQRGADVTWAAMVREMIEALLQAEAGGRASAEGGEPGASVRGAS